MEIDYSLFTEKARAAYRTAITQARQCRYPLVEPPVMLVAIIQDGRDMFAFMLNRLQVERVAFCGAVQDLLQTMPRSDRPSSLPSLELERIFARAINLANANGARVVALEHIFWAMGEEPGTIRDLMQRLGITASKLKEAVLEFRGGSGQVVSQTRQNEEETVSTLSKYAKNLVKLAEEGEIEPAFGRDAEIRRMLEILSRRTKNNPVLVGEPGTGKTAIVEGLAHRILRGDVPQELREVRLYELDISAMVAGASAQGEFEERLKQVIAEVTRTPYVVLFIDELHTLIGAGRSSGAMDAANILKPELARGKLRVIGATTSDEYIKYIESDKAFERRFRKVAVEEPDVDSAISIMRNIKGRFETHHRIKILDSAVVAAVKMSHRYIADRFLPDKAIDLLDEAASRMRIDRSSVPKELDELMRSIRTKEVELASISQDGGMEREIDVLSREIANLRERENTLNAKWQNERSLFEQLQGFQDEIDEAKKNREIAEQEQRFGDVVEYDRKIRTAEMAASAITSELDGERDNLLKTALDDLDIMEVVTDATGIPVARLKRNEAENLLRLEALLGEKIVGQKKAIAAIAKVIRRNRAGLGDSGRPIGSFLFLGTTGVGKTELTKALCEYLFNSREAIVRIDMSEYQQEHSVSRLFGAPPGYVGYDQGGQLTEAVRKKPYCVVLFDEVEKAHPKVFETLLQVLDEGRMTDGQGRTVDFRNTIIVMTSNIGYDVIRANLLQGDVCNSVVEETTTAVIAQLRERVAPEFLNRIDEVVMFLPLTRDEIRLIVELQIQKFKEKVTQRGVQVVFEGDAIDFLVEKSFIPEYGARPVKRAIDEYVVNPLSIAMLDGSIGKDKPLYVKRIGAELRFTETQ